MIKDIIHSVLEPKSLKRAKVIQYYIDWNDCHICQSHYKDQDGYPRITRFGKPWRLNRYIYFITYGSINEHLVVRHKCNNPNCINPIHLELGTHVDNIMDKVRSNRQAKGSKHGCAKLNEEDVRHVKENLNERTSILAKKFCVAPNTISNIKAGRNWAWIK